MAVKNRSSVLSVDRIYSILGLLIYGEKVKVSYKPRICLNCPNQKEAKDCTHEEKNKSLPVYTEDELENALFEVMKVAVENGYGEPLSWHGSGNGWLPKIDENGSIEIVGSIKISISQSDISFKEDKSIEIIGSEYPIYCCGEIHSELSQ
jgi:hypothetical protein